MTKQSVIEKDEANVILIADSKAYPLRSAMVAFRSDKPESLRIAIDSNNPIPATAKKLVLVLDGLDTRISVLREDCIGSVAPADVHFHLKVPDQNHREMIAKRCQFYENSPA
jgi:hypothetical protein